ncbi:hypothetical protein DRJ16_04795 [Candidatus Woesearchaeota archaeon]|nr:MAG: hypothetical protein DRJ16_04795 [Candidatus Woesearchaeota archaeon]
MLPLSESEAKVMNYLYKCKNEPKYAAEIARALGIPRRTIYDTLESLKKKGIVEEVEKKGIHTFYRLSKKWFDVAEAAKTHAETDESPLNRKKVLELDLKEKLRATKDILNLLATRRILDSPTVEEVKKALKKLERTGVQ